MDITQLDFARSGILTNYMKEAALAEGVTPEFIRSGIADGTIIICHNLKRNGGRPLAVGKGLRTKVNANIGTSADDLDISKELEKARVAVKYGADAIMDLSTGGPVDEIRRAIIAETHARDAGADIGPGEGQEDVKAGCGAGAAIDENAAGGVAANGDGVGQSVAEYGQKTGGGAERGSDSHGGNPFER